jgi:tight adherence protein B
MVTWYRSLAVAAGFSSDAVVWLAVTSLALSLLAGGLALEISKVPAFAFSITIVLLAFTLEWLMIRSKSRRRAVINAWPEVLDSLVSASSSGISLFEAFLELADSAPTTLQPYFKQLERDLEAGMDLNAALRQLRDALVDVHVDRLVELIRIITSAGGQGFHAALRNQAIQVRAELALNGELESKQGWVTGTAKVAIMAPWLIVVMLCSRPENVDAYASSQGTAILLTGLFVSIFAYRLIQLFGSVGEPVRVFRR